MHTTMIIAPVFTLVSNNVNTDKERMRQSEETSDKK